MTEIEKKALEEAIYDSAEYIKNLQADNEELKERLNYIWAIGCDYDGANPNDATQMRQLVDELVGIAVDGLEQTVFCGDEKTEIQPRAVKLYNLKAENARLTEQLKNTVEALKAVIERELDYKPEECYMKKLINSELEEAEARLAELKEKE